MVRKENIDKYAARKPFEPFEVRLVDGQRYRWQFLVGRTTLAALTPSDEIVHLSLGMISKVGPPPRRARRRPRGKR